jgi:hypothetical protein
LLLTFSYEQLIVMPLRDSLMTERSSVIMPLRILDILSLSAVIIVGAVGYASAGGGYNAPELDPGAVGSGLAFLAGAVLLLAERRRGGKR